MKKSTIHLIGILLILLIGNGYPGAYAQGRINWPQFMQRNDMVFDTLTTHWEEGAFMGNGLLGAMVFMKDSNALRFEIGRTDVVDHRKEKINELIAG